MCRSCFLITLSLLPLAVLAFPSIRSHFPNGHRIPCPTGATGCKDGICQGVGHANCYGGSMPLNKFGQDMKKYNFEWSKELCEADSDGDGLSNGEELGDPCCLWKAWGTPSDYAGNFTPSHPGDKNANQTGYQRPACGKTTPKAMAPIMGKFNPGEVQKFVDIRIDNYSLPVPGNLGGRTTYVDIAWNFPDESADLFHVVWADAIIATPKNLHHYVVRGCPDVWPKEKDGKVVSAMDARACRTYIGGWTPGRKIVEMPAWAGLPIGKKAGLKSFVVNVHFDNPAMEKGIISRDGMRLHYTPTLRNDTLTNLDVMQVSVNPTMNIPAHKSRYYMTRECTLKVQDSNNKDVEAHILGTSFHAHLLGTDMSIERIRDGKRQKISVESPWHFDDQYFDNVYVRNITLKTGDKLESSCIFNSQGRDTLTVIGQETTDEMCWSTLMVTPGSLKATCTGHVWTGELNATEPLLGIQIRHPEKGADGSWDGANLKSGGNVITAKYMPKLGSCTDYKPVMAFCPILVNIPMLAAFGPAACNMTMAEMGRSQPAEMAKLTGMQMCCTEVCKSVCPNHHECKAKFGTPSSSKAIATSLATSTTKSPASMPTNGGQHMHGGLKALITGWVATALVF